MVTGSLIRRANVETSSPITVLDNETLTKAGITNINDAIRSVSADGAGSISTGYQSGFSAGGAAVSLRGLGVSSTLVLIDGQRTTNFPLNDDGHNAYVDLNSIPFSAVERVDVFKDGASATYGADAIGGVVNIIMKKHFTGVAGTVEGGVSQYGDAGRLRANLTAGVGDYETQGYNFYINGEYQHDGRVSAKNRRYPYNTNDLSRSGLADQNADDDSLAGSSGLGTVSAVVRRATQTDLNDPFAALAGSATGQYTTLNLDCAGNTFTVPGAAGGVGCRHDTTYEYGQIQPLQERYNAQARFSVRLSDNIEAYVTGSYSHNSVRISGLPQTIRQRQPYGAPATQSSRAPGIVLPVYICASGANCATASDRRLNPNNPYAAAYALNPSEGAASLYYRFGDIESASTRTNEVIRGAAGVKGTFGDGFGFTVDAVGAKDNLSLTSYGTIDIAGLKQAINTGAYDFVNPASNTEAARNLVAPTITAKSHTSLASLEGSLQKSLVKLPGGDLVLAVGGQVRRETLENNSLNPTLSNFGSTAAAFGKHTVTAGYFELNAPIVQQLEVNVSGRYDHYSEGFNHFSPKVGVIARPIERITLRGTFSKGFRAPTFAESNPRSSYPGFVNFTPPAAFIAAHGGAGNPYSQSYSVGGGFTGNPDLKPEKSRNFTGGVTYEPVRWLSVSVDYYNVKKTDTIVAGPDAGRARAAYYSQSTLPAAIAAVAAIPGYSVNAIDAIDPLFPTALPRVLVINGPYVNSGFFKTQGLDFSATATVPIADGIRFISRVDVTDVLKYNVDFGDGVIRKYVGTLGPYELSSGAGTPKWRGNWQNTIEIGKFSLTATTYFVSKIKQVAADEEAPGPDGTIDLSCGTAAGDLYPFPNPAGQCNIKKFIYADLNATVTVNDGLQIFANVGNFTNEKAPIAPASYSGINYLSTWHYAGVIGRTFRAGASFSF